MKFYDVFTGTFHYYTRDTRPIVRETKARISEFMPVSVSGYCLSEGKFFYNLHGAIGDVSCFPRFKVWPFSPLGDGKLWFDVSHARVERLLFPGEKA